MLFIGKNPECKQENCGVHSKNAYVIESGVINTSAAFDIMLQAIALSCTASRASRSRANGLYIIYQDSKHLQFVEEMKQLA